MFQLNFSFLISFVQLNVYVKSLLSLTFVVTIISQTLVKIEKVKIRIYYIIEPNRRLFSNLVSLFSDFARSNRQFLEIFRSETPRSKSETWTYFRIE